MGGRGKNNEIFVAFGGFLFFLTIVGAHDSVGFAWIRISNSLVIITIVLALWNHQG